VVLNALATSGDANILATPHIIATDNVQAEINVGENIPLQENFAGAPNLSSLAGLAGGQAGQAAGALGALGGLGGLGGFGNAQRQDVGTRIKVTPHINDEYQVRLEIEEEISEKGAASGNLGAVSITQRNAMTTVVVDDQQTVVIGGLMRDTLEKTKTKVPVLGDLPVLGFLFRTSQNRTRKTNLLLILTPYVIRDQADLRKVFERKMQERQEFLDRYFVFNSDWEPPRDFSRTNGLVESIRQSYREVDEQLALEAELAPGAVKEHYPSAALELPGSVRVGQTTQGATRAPTPAPAAAPGAPAQPRPRRRNRRRNQNQQQNQAPQLRPQQQGDASPIQINPLARSVNVERTE
jgi:general secretion pathway protein D